MINSVSSVSFGTGQVNLGREGKHSKTVQTANSQTTNVPAKKGKTGKVLGWIVGLAAAAFIALGITKGKMGDKWVKAVAEEGQSLGITKQIKNWGLVIAENSVETGKWFKGLIPKKAPVEA